MPPVRASRCVDGNEAAARVAYALSEVVAIYPITPASAMGELADAWSAAGRTNLFGDVPQVVEMQSEGGAAGALHGAIQRGALGTTFTASQGLLLMYPNMFKIAGELTPVVFHVAARSVATHALSIFGDHSDVMAVRPSGFAMLASGSVQEAHDLALVAHAATLESRVPFVHFFDGFRTSHEVNEIQMLSDDDLRALVDEEWIRAHRARALSPDHPFIRGTAQNPDTFFQAREAANPYYLGVPAAVQGALDRLAERTGRRYGLVDYAGAPDAERVVVLMGSGGGAAHEAVEAMCAARDRVGVVTVRLFRPFPAAELVRAIPETVHAVAVLDRTKEPGAPGEPLYQDVVAAFAGAPGRVTPTVVGGRYGLSSKQFSPSMVKGVFDELGRSDPRPHITVGIVDDVTGTSVPPDPAFRVDTGAVEAVLYGLGSDGTVSAARAAVKAVGEQTDLFAQGYFAYDSRKSGQLTASHLRFSDAPVRSTYLIEQADVVACHQFGFVEQRDVLKRVKPGGTFLLNSPYGADEVWERLPVEVQEQIVEKRLSFHVVDAHAIARELGLGGRINWVMVPCLFAVTDVMAVSDLMADLEAILDQEYGTRGRAVVDRNLDAARRGLDALAEVDVPAAVAGDHHRRSFVFADAPDFVQRVTARLVAGEGDLLPVSAFPPDGTFPSATARYEKRAIAQEIPAWDPELCIDCGKCAIACPHAAVRMKVFEPPGPEGAPQGFLDKAFRSKDLEGYRLSIQVAPDDCTGCGICVDVCPVESKDREGWKALNMVAALERRESERDNWEYFGTIPDLDRSLVPHDVTKTSQLLEPLFEFSGACSGCGETPYLKLLTQLSGDRLLVANATGCSSIFGGNLPTTPWSVNAEGRGPAWSNSLFEDNAEFGLGMRIALDQQIAAAERLLERLAPEVGDELARAILDATQDDEVGIAAQRERVARLDVRLTELGDDPDAARLAALSEVLVRKNVWIVGGDGWAYDIGYGGLDHVLASGRDVNVLVLDTEVYSNTGGQASKATPRAAVAKFAAAGKPTPKKDLGLEAATYGNVYVAQVAIGANDRQTVKALVEAEAWPGPSIVIAYATCIAHGIDMATSMSHQKDAVASGYWPLWRYRPGTGDDEHPFHLDSHEPKIPVSAFAGVEHRFSALGRTDPERAETLLTLAQADVDERWSLYRQLSEVERQAPEPDPGAPEQGHAASDE